MNEYAIYLKLDDYEIDAFLHFNDLSYSGVPEDVAKNFKLKDKLKVKVLEIKTNEQKIEAGLTINENVSSKTLNTNPFDLRLIYNKRTGFSESYGFSVTIVKK